MSWNVWWRFGGNWRVREPRIRAVVQSVAPDLLGLQETWWASGTSQAGEIADRLGMYAAVVPTSIPPTPDPIEHPDQAGAGMGIGLVSRWPLMNVSAHELPARHRQPPTALGAEVGHPRGALHVIVACTEWEPAHVEDHVAQIRALAELLADPRLDGDLPVLLLGDLNAPPDSPELSGIAAVATDLWVAGRGDPRAATLSGSTPYAPLDATRQIDRRIDYVFARPGRAGAPLNVQRSFLAGRRAVDGIVPSDHFATVSDLEL